MLALGLALTAAWRFLASVRTLPAIYAPRFCTGGEVENTRYSTGTCVASCAGRRGPARAGAGVGEWSSSEVRVHERGWRCPAPQVMRIHTVGIRR